jgi:hypothetical protein
MYTTSANTAATGRNPSAVNSERTAIAVAALNSRLCRNDGCSAHTMSERKAAPRQAVSAMSVVAKPA